MEEDSLQELDKILKPIIERSYQAAKRESYNGTPSGKSILEHFQVEIDNTRVAISSQFYKIDKLMQHNASLRKSSAKPKQPKVDSKKYVRESNGGYQVFNGIKWVQLSNEARINLKIESNWETANKAAVILSASDPKTNTHVRYVDKDVFTKGFDYSYTGDKMGSEQTSSTLPSRYMYWEDPFYATVKKGVSITGKTAGALGARNIGNLTPWRTGSNIEFAKGWYRNKEGIYRKLSSQKGLGAGGHQVGTRNALKRASKFKAVGKKMLWVSAAISFYEVTDVLVNDDSNKWNVTTKASIDITMGLIGFYGGPIGWLVSGTYFILDISGAFGDWGKPSGIRSDGVPYNFNQFEYDHEIEFNIEFVKEIQEKKLLEMRNVKIDKTSVVKPRILLRKN
ncbi:hypothetical protein [Cellulophaga sp. L1A9]|uniref:hypothetical protein n=1 Tax=Cellulophaga sp. L1A9 TaxID=2686362 RepID=UPI00131D45EF|nr:hypothetical protein [Cellulophaga sp. L1A9]